MPRGYKLEQKLNHGLLGWRQACFRSALITQQIGFRFVHYGSGPDIKLNGSLGRREVRRFCRWRRVRTRRFCVAVVHFRLWNIQEIRLGRPIQLLIDVIIGVKMFLPIKGWHFWKHVECVTPHTKLTKLQRVTKVTDYTTKRVACGWARAEGGWAGAVIVKNH